jgi:hypothetical protein
MKIKCINIDDCKGLTLGKIYETDKLSCMAYMIKNDLGHKERYFDFRFVEIKED